MPCPRTQQASLPACFPHYPLYMLSAKQGSCEYHFLESFNMTRLRNETHVYRQQCGRSNHCTIASVFHKIVVVVCFRCICNKGVLGENEGRRIPQDRGSRLPSFSPKTPLLQIHTNTREWTQLRSVI